MEITMQNFIQAKTVLITGASSGIGAQLAKDLAAMNVNLVLAARNKDKLSQLASDILSTNKSITVEVLTMDVSNKKVVNEKISSYLKLKSIDILINNAGLAIGNDKVDSANTDDWDKRIDTNLKGLLYVSRALIPHFKKLQTSHIVNLGSVAGKTAYPGGNVYCATKAAVHSLGEAMNADLLGTGVKVSTIAPGAVETNFSAIRFPGEIEKQKGIYAGYTPLSSMDISAAIIGIINTPPHVNIQYMDIMPTAQRNPFLISKLDSNS
jgi:3-hydroxy acid dehydrogenase/malonic semialdehyde reductase